MKRGRRFIRPRCSASNRRGTTEGGNASLSGMYGLAGGRRRRGPNAKAQRRGEEEEKGLVVACRGMGILPMTLHRRPARRTSCTPAGGDARATSKTVRLSPSEGFFPPITEALRNAFCFG
jgi:hypothetical protein